MNFKQGLLAVLSLIPGYAFAQAPEAYTTHIKEAEAFYESKDYIKSAKAYRDAFSAFGGRGFPNDRYNAACTWSQAGNADSAFFQLFRIAERTAYSDLNHMSVDTDLDPIKKDKRWPELYALVKANKEKKEAGLNKPLVAILDTVMLEDQQGRMQIEEVQKKYGRESAEIKALWKSINEKDSINLIKVTGILDKYGWLGPLDIGAEGNNALFLVIQHADLKTQQKYLPMMRDAVKNYKAQSSALALLEDRVAVRTGKKQIYGSQISMDKEGKAYISALEDPDNVDKRRAEVGLGPLAQYVDHWQIKWDVEAYKKQLPELEKRMKADMY